MSSRSDVCIVISKKVTIPEEVENAMSDAESTHETDEAKYWYWSYVKWNSLDPSVKIVEDFLRSLDDQDDGMDLYGFIEVGEYGVDHRGNPASFDLYYRMEIDKPF